MAAQKEIDQEKELALWQEEHPVQKQEIDAMGYEQMLRRWRFAAFGDPMFQSLRGAYFAKVMAEKRDADPAAAVAASKAIGWEKP